MRLVARLPAMPYPMNTAQEKGSGQPAMNRSKQGACMTTKIIVVVAIGLILGLVHIAPAQQPTKIPRLGLVSGSGDPKTSERYVEAFRQGLRDLGYIDGRNILIDFRSMEGTVDSIPSLVAELVRLRSTYLSFNL